MGLIIWIKVTFNKLNFGNLIFHLKVPLKGGTPIRYYYSFTLFNLFIPVILTLSISFLHIKFVHSDLKGISSLLFPLVFTLKHIELTVLVLFIIDVFLVIVFVDFKSFISYYKKTTLIYNTHYIDPIKTKITFPDTKNNLILIYLESMESSFQSKDSGGYFDINFIPELTELASENINFSSTNNIDGAIQILGAEWTMAAMVASSCGIPLRIPVHQNGMFRYQKFLPGVMSIGDILNEQGYEQVLMIGYRKNFAGTDLFFEPHGNYKIIDPDYFKQKGLINKDYKFGWGIEDYRIYECAKEEIKNLSKQNVPFNFTMATVDTHEPNGYTCPSCTKKHSDKYKNVLSCASRQLYDFILWIQAESFYKNTTIVVLGDHLSRVSKDFGSHRRIFNVIINSRILPKKAKNREFCTLDWFPTIIESIGGNIEAEGLALGRSLFGNNKTLIEELGFDKFQKEINMNSAIYDKLLFEN